MNRTNENFAVFTCGLRTPFTQAGRGAYKDVRPDELLAGLFNANKKKFPDIWRKGPPDDVVVGCAYPEGEQGYNVARMAALGAGLESPGITVNRLCASSLSAAALAAACIGSGYGARYLVGGIESMSRVTRRGAGFSESEFIKSSFPKAYITMGETAEEVARRFPDITRVMQEDFAQHSHELAFAAYEKGLYGDQIMEDPRARRDEGIRYPVNREKMAQLPPAFTPEGTVTAATSSPLSDGAACGWVINGREAREAGIADGMIIRDVTVSHVPPEIMGMGPEPAVRALLVKNGLSSFSRIAAVEMNEAFAIQALACRKMLGLDTASLNAWGGALALGHPLGASGLRLLMTLLARLRCSGEPGALGIASLCVGGGQGVALLGEYIKFA